MECNKVEAIRAMEIAQKKMEKNDFEGARNITEKARSLYPELENVNRMLSICDVHCSAKKRLIGSEKDWYEILQLEKLTDVLTVKKQYRQLALQLHPDKNQFPGAEGAFKLICEANMILSDPVKKSLYDGKVRVSVGTTALVNPHMDKNLPVERQYSSGNNVCNGYTNKFQHQAAESNSYSGPEMFCTSCPYCKMRCQYPKKFVRRSISCPGCRKIFIDNEVIFPENPSRTKSGTSGTAQHDPSRPKLTRPASYPEKSASNMGNCKIGIQKDQSPPAWQGHSQAVAGSENIEPEPAVQMNTRSKDIKIEDAAKNVENSRTNGTDNKSMWSLHCHKEMGTANGDLSHKETCDPKNISRKRVRKESNASCDSSTGVYFQDFSGGNNVSIAHSSTFQHQAVKSNSSSGLEMFCTSCPYCNMRCRYPRQFVRRSIRCPGCRKIFINYEVIVQDNPSRTKSGTSGTAFGFGTYLKFESVQVHPPQRSSRKKQRVLYNETEADDLIDPPLNIPQVAKEDNVSENPKNPP